MVDVFAAAFPDMHRDIHHVYETSDKGDRRNAEHQIMRSLAEGSGETPQVLCRATV